MTSSIDTKARNRYLPLFRVAYALMVVLGFYFLIFKNDISTAISNLGISLVFDPFDHRVSWAKRPRYQRVWLVVHLITLFGMILFYLYTKLMR